MEIHKQIHQDFNHLPQVVKDGITGRKGKPTHTFSLGQVIRAQKAGQSLRAVQRALEIQSTDTSLIGTSNDDRASRPQKIRNWRGGGT